MDRKFTPKQGMRVRHFKGNTYEILCVALHTETEEQLVIYQSEESGNIFARPYKMFCDKVDKERYPNSTQTYRLEEID